MKYQKYKGHDMDRGKLVLSFHQRWCVSVASDGKLLLRLAGNPVGVVEYRKYALLMNIVKSLISCGQLV